MRLWLLAALALTPASAGASVPTPEALRHWHDRDMRVAGIGARLRRANVALCPDAVPDPGLAVWSLDPTMTADWHAAWASALGLGEGAQVTWVAPGGGADHAGLQVGDVVLAIDGAALADGRAAFFAALGRALTQPRMRVDILRDGRVVALTVVATPACPATVELLDRHQRNAETRGTAIFIYSGMESTLADDDELAFIIAHELAHAIRGDALVGQEKALRDPAIRGRTERDADDLGVAMMARAGFDPDAAARAQDRLAPLQKGWLTGMLGLEFHGAYPRAADRSAHLRKRAAEVRAGGGLLTGGDLADVRRCDRGGQGDGFRL